MKYLITLASLIIAVIIISIIYLIPDPPPAEETVAMTINGKIISKEGVDEQGKKTGYHQDEHEELLNSMITRELLIQEAQRQNIDKEPEFRKALKDFYEQSLIKTLMDRQIRQEDFNVSQEEIQKYTKLIGKTVSFTKIPTDPNGTPLHTDADQLSISTKFNDLADQMQLILATMDIGQTETIFETGSSLYAIRLDEISGSSSQQTSSINEEEIRQAISEYKREQSINKWIKSLREKATITIHQD